MGSKREQVLVGLFVLVAAGVLVGAVIGVTGAFSGTGVPYRTTIAFAGGLEPGAIVRYAGSPEVGRVKELHVDPRDPSRIEITFTVRPDIPVKTDSHVKIMSISALGDNNLEVMAGSPQAARAPANTELPSQPYVDFNGVLDEVNVIGPEAQQLLATLNERGMELQVTINRLNDMLSAQNRSNLTESLAEARGMLAEDRPELKATLTNAESATEKLTPLIDNFQNTSRQADQTLAQLDSMIGEDRPELHQSILELRRTLDSANDVTSQLNRTLNVNSDNIDDVLDNVRHITKNLKEFTETLKTRPSALIWKGAPAEHVPGQPK